MGEAIVRTGGYDVVGTGFFLGDQMLTKDVCFGSGVVVVV